MNPEPQDDEEDDLGHTRVYGVNGTMFGAPRAEPTFSLCMATFGDVFCQRPTGHDGDHCNHDAGGGSIRAWTDAQAEKMARYHSADPPVPPEPVVATTWPGEVARLTRDLAAMSERCRRAELDVKASHARLDVMAARVRELEADLAAVQQARVAEVLDRASRAITGRPAAEVSAELTEQLSGDPEQIDGPERFRADDDDQTVVVDLAPMTPERIRQCVAEQRSRTLPNQDPLVRLADLCHNRATIARAIRDLQVESETRDPRYENHRRRRRQELREQQDRIERDIAIACGSLAAVR